MQGAAQVSLLLDLYEFLKVARPIWCDAIKNTVDQYVNDPTESNLKHILRYTNIKLAKGGVSSVTNNIELVHQYVSQWLTNVEQKNVVFESVKNILCFKDYRKIQILYFSMGG